MKPTLLVAWSSADWKIIRSLLDNGQMPHLRQLMARGVHANLATLQPQSAPLQWTSLATGKRADEHALLGPLCVDEGRWARPTCSLDRRVPALWNMVERRGLRAHVVNWPYSHPAERLDGAMVSELFAWVTGEPQAHAPWTAGSVAAAGLEDALADMRVHPGEFDLDMLSWFVPSAPEVDQQQDRLLAHVAIALARGASTHAAATLLLEEAPPALLAVCYDALALLGPRFMALYPPQLPYIPAELFERYREVVPRMYEYLDMQLGRLVELAGEGAQIALVSERGIHSDHLRPQTPELAVQRLAAPWVRDQGVLVMAGPGLRAGERIEGAGLLDVVPTLLTMMDLPIGKDMPGRPLLQALVKRRAPERIGTWDCKPQIFPAPDPSPDPCPDSLTDAVTAALLQSRVASGEIGPELLDRDALAQAPLAEGVAADARFNLAMVYLESRRPALALPLLERLHADAPGDDRISLHYARCLQAAGNVERARKLMQGVAEAGPPRPREHLMLSRMHQQDANPAKALASLFRAEQASPGQPSLHCRIGEVYLQMKRWPDAERAFRKALALEADHALAHHGLAIVHLAAGRNEEAVDAALTATGLRHQSPQAHFHLGVGLARTGRALEAVQAFETCVAQNTHNIEAHQWLVQLYRDVLSDRAKADHHGSWVARLQVSALLR